MQLLSGLSDLTPAKVLSEAREIRKLERELGATKLIRATEWADLHPAMDDEEGAWPDEMAPSLPRVAWDAPAEFAAAFGMTTDGGTYTIQEALEGRHRLPRTWARMLAGQVDGWRLRRIAERTMGESDLVAAAVDRVVAPIAHKAGVKTLDRLLTETLIRFEPDRVARESAAALDRRHVKVYDDVSHLGVMKMEIRADLKDVLDFEDTVAQIAAALANDPDCPESLDIRRSMAVGILADPQQALDLLNGNSATAATNDGTTDDGEPGPGRAGAQPDGPDQASASGVLRKPGKQIRLHVHMSEAAVSGFSPVGNMEYAGRVVLADRIRDWCGRTDTHVTVLPVIDLNEHLATDSYRPTDRLTSQTELKHLICQFPWCNRPARRCDKDHCIPHDDGGRTCSCNLVPLCRRHHRLKTHTLWRYQVLEPGVFLWRAPQGHQFLRDASGTTDIGPGPDSWPAAGDRSPPWDGCFYSSAS